MQRIRVPTASTIIALVSILYTVAEWRSTRTIGGNTLFGENRASERSEWNSFVLTIDQLIVSNCEGGRTKLIVFSDSDVALPYVLRRVTAEEASGHCVIVRPTAVTPINVSNLPNICSAMLVKEGKRYGQQTSQFKPEGGWVGDTSRWKEEQGWSSPTGLYRLSTYRYAGCSEKSR